MNPNKKTKNGRKPMRCPYCGSAMTLRPASDVYGNTQTDGWLYVCNSYPRCDAYVGTHPGTKTPLGMPADGHLRNLRIRAHKVFDQIWRNGVMSRNQAYRWMADLFCIPLRDAHIGSFSEYRCTALIRKCEEVLERNGLRHERESA